MREIWGLLPADGKATRSGKRKGPSREILPLAVTGAASGETPPRIACQDLLDNFRFAGVARAIVVLRQGKWDVPRRLGDGGEYGVELVYRMLSTAAASRGVPFAVAAAAPFLGDRMAAVGFPDLLLQPRDLLARLVRHREQTQSDLALALVPCDRQHGLDRVDLSARGKVRRIEIQPESTSLKWTWALALWTPRFVKFLLRWTESFRPRSARLGREVRLADVFAAALAEGFEIDALPEASGRLAEIVLPESPAP